MKKRLAFILIITILINTVIPNFIYADQTTDVAGDTKFEDVQKHQNEKGESNNVEVYLWSISRWHYRSSVDVLVAD